jgi:hypothetical protein
MAPNVYIRGLSGRGFRVPVVGGTIAVCKDGTAVQVDLADVKVREILSRERENFVRVANGADTTPLLRGLSRQGFRVRNQGGTITRVVQGAATEVDLAVPATVRTLKRAKREFLYAGATDNDLRSIYGLVSSQASFRVKNPTLTLEFAGANNDLTFVPKVRGGENISIALIDDGNNEQAETVSVTNRAIEVTLDITQNVQASLTTAITGANNDLVWTARPAYPGTSGHAIEIRYVVSGNNTPLSVSVTGTVITVNVATNGSGDPTSTAAQVAAAVAAHTAANALVSSANASGNNGTGVVAAVSQTALSGGVDETVRSTAADVIAAIEADTGVGEGFANNLVTVTAEGTGLGVVAPVAATALGDDPEPIGPGETVTVDTSDPFNIAQLRRHYRAWIEA